MRSSLHHRYRDPIGVCNLENMRRKERRMQLHHVISPLARTGGGGRHGHHVCVDLVSAQHVLDPPLQRLFPHRHHHLHVPFDELQLSEVKRRRSAPLGGALGRGEVDVHAAADAAGPRRHRRLATQSGARRGRRLEPAVACPREARQERVRLGVGHDPRVWCTRRAGHLQGDADAERRAEACIWKYTGACQGCCEDRSGVLIGTTNKRRPPRAFCGDEGDGSLHLLHQNGRDTQAQPGALRLDAARRRELRLLKNRGRGGRQQKSNRHTTIKRFDHPKE